jgi:hypothetical protein
LFTGIERPEREGDYSLPSSAEVNNAWGVHLHSLYTPHDPLLTNGANRYLKNSGYILLHAFVAKCAKENPTAPLSHIFHEVDVLFNLQPVAKIDVFSVMNIHVVVFCVLRW